MRSLIIPSLLLAIAGGAYCADDSSDKELHKAEHKAIDNKAINTVDPVTGDKVDANLAPVSAKTHDGKSILIGVSSEASQTKISKDPGKYVDAALADKKSEEK